MPNKSELNQRIVFRLDEKLLRGLEDAADLREVCISELIRTICNRSVSQRLNHKHQDFKKQAPPIHF